MVLFVSKFVGSKCCCDCHLFQEMDFLLLPLLPCGTDDYNGYDNDDYNGPDNDYHNDERD